MSQTDEIGLVSVGASLERVVDGLVAEYELENEWNAYLDSYAGATPLPLGREVMPFMDFDLASRREIAAVVLCDDRPPPKWLDFGFAQITSRAWCEWHWHRGIDPERPRRSKVGSVLRRQVIARDGFVCGLCREAVEPSDVHIDHILPVSLGGGDVLDNLQVAHSLCNLRKGARYEG